MVLSAVATDSIDYELVRLPLEPPSLQNRPYVVKELSELTEFLRQPNASLLLYLKGYRSISCPGSGKGVVKAYSVSGHVTEIVGCYDADLEAFLPLQPPPQLFKGYRVIASSSSWSAVREVLTDTYTVDGTAIRVCRPAIGCYTYEKIERIGKGEVVSTNVLRPLVVYPLPFAVWRKRVWRDSLQVVAPWLCVKGYTTSYTMLCISDGCTYTVYSNGEINVEEGESVVVRGCSPYLASSVYAASTYSVLFSDRNVYDPPLLLACPVTVLAAFSKEEDHGFGSRTRFRIILWNPFRKVTDCEVYARRVKLSEIDVYDFYDFSWTRLRYIYNRVRFALPPYGLVYLDVKGRIGKVAKLFG